MTQRLNVWYVKLPTVVLIFIAMKLQDINGATRKTLKNRLGGGIHKQTDLHQERRKLLNNVASSG